MNERIFNKDNQAEEVIVSKIEERKKVKDSLIDVNSLPDSIKNAAIKAGKIQQLTAFFDKLPAGEVRDVMFNLLNSISNNQDEVDFFIKNLWTKIGPTSDGKIDINPNDYKPGTLGYKIFELKPAGMGKGEILFAWRIKDSKIQGGGVNFDLETPHGKFEVKDYRSKKSPNAHAPIRLGVKGRAPQYKFFIEILETITLLEKMMNIDSLSDDNKFLIHFKDRDLLETIHYIMNRSSFIRSGEFNKTDQRKFKLFYDKMSKIKYTPNVYVKAILRGPGGKPLEIDIEPILIEDANKSNDINIIKKGKNISSIDSILSEFRRLKYVRNTKDLSNDLQKAVNTAVGNIPLVVFRNTGINVTREFKFSHVSQSGIFIIEKSISEK